MPLNIAIHVHVCTFGGVSIEPDFDQSVILYNKHNNI